MAWERLHHKVVMILRHTTADENGSVDNPEGAGRDEAIFRAGQKEHKGDRSTGGGTRVEMGFRQGTSPCPTWD